MKPKHWYIICLIVALALAGCPPDNDGPSDEPVGPTFISDFGGGTVRTMKPLNGGLWAIIYNEETAGQVWFSDGTSAGTTLVKEIPDTGMAWYFGAPCTLTVGNTVYFSVFQPIIGKDYVDPGDNALWRSDGTADGTVAMVQTPGGCNFMHVMDDIVYFYASTPNSNLWRTDGTGTGTYIVESGLYTKESFVVGDTMFFQGNGSPYRLWRTDGSHEGTYPLQASQANQVCAGAFFAIGDTVFFEGDDNDSHSSGLWRSDGTEDGTYFLKTIRDGMAAACDIMGRATLDDKAVFFANDGEHGRELWATDGTADGTTLIKDIRPGSDPWSPSDFAVLNGVAYFFADDTVHGTQLWKTDGTAEGTGMVMDEKAASRMSLPEKANTNFFLKVVDGQLYTSRKLSLPTRTDFCRTDGTAEGTVALATFEGSNLISDMWIQDGVTYFTWKDRLGRLNGDTTEWVELYDADTGETIPAASYRPVTIGDYTYYIAEGGLWAVNNATNSNA